MPLAALAAFVFARFVFPGREVLYAVFTLGLLFPVAVAILPIFIMVRNLGLLDNPLGVALPQAAFGLPMTIVILRPFFASFPNELQDAAAIDGCGPFRFFWRILLPLSRPVLATVSVLALVGSLERVPAAAGRADRGRQLDAAARRHQLLDAVHGRHRADPRLHDALDGAGAGLLRVRRAPPRRAGSPAARSRAERPRPPERTAARSPYGAVVDSVNVSVFAYVPVRSASLALTCWRKPSVTASLEIGAL